MSHQGGGCSYTKAVKERAMKVHEIIFRKNGKNTDS